MIRRWLPAIVIFFLWLPLEGQETGRVRGVLRDSSGKAIPFANISVTGLQQGTVSDSAGFYSLTVPAGRDMILVFSVLGFERFEKTIHLRSGEILVLDIILVTTFRELDEVEITGRYERRNSFHRIDMREVAALPSVTGQIESVLKTLPGVSSSNELSSQYSVRGGNFDENLVYVNDVEIYRPFLVRSGQQEGLSFINPDMVSSLRFSAGGFDAMYGDKMSSVLDIRYREPVEPAGSVSLSFLGGSAHMEGISSGSKLSYIGGIRYKTTRYLLGTLDTEGNYNPDFADLQAFITYRQSEKLEFSLLGNIADNHYRFAPGNRKTSFGTVSDAVQLYILYDGEESDRFLTYTGAVTASYRPAGPLTLKLIVSAFQTSESETFDILGRYSLNELEKKLGSEALGDSVMNIGIGSFLDHARNYLDANVYSLEHKGEYRFPVSRLNWGIRLQAEDITNRISEWKMVDSAGYSIPYTGESVNLSYVYRVSHGLFSRRFSSYVQYNQEIRLGRASLDLDAGTRISFWDFNREWLLSPRLSAWLDPGWDRDFQFHLSAGYYFQPAFFKEMRDHTGQINPGIRAQQSLHVVLGADYNLRIWERPFCFMAELYYKDLDRLVPYKIDNVRIRYSGNNMAYGYAAGLDLKLNGEFVDGVESWASLSLMQTRENIRGDQYPDREGTTVFPGYYPRPADQLVTFALYFQDYLPMDPSYRMQLSLHFGSGLPTSAPFTDRYDQVFRMPSYRRVDIGFTKVIIDEEARPAAGRKSIFKNLAVSAEVFNLLDVQNTISYLWIKTINNLSGDSFLFAVPNYLTSRRLNVKLTARF